MSKVILLLVMFAVGYGVWNSYNPRLVNYSITSQSLSPFWQNKKIIIISDIHISNSRTDNYLRKIISKINNEQPDVVFLVGDLIEGTSFPYQKWLNEFDSLKSTYGTYYAEGNHERYSQEYELFRSNFPKSLIDLTNKKIILNNTQIIGLPFNQRQEPDETISILNNLGYDKSIPSIILVHDPKNTEAIASLEASLILSGHTHSGQFFPFTLLIKKIYKNLSHGVNYFDKSVSVVSNGVGSSVIPIRLGTNPEIIVLNIR